MASDKFSKLRIKSFQEVCRKFIRDSEDSAMYKIVKYIIKEFMEDKGIILMESEISWMSKAGKEGMTIYFGPLCASVNRVDNKLTVGHTFRYSNNDGITLENYNFSNMSILEILNIMYTELIKYDKTAMTIFAIGRNLQLLFEKHHHIVVENDEWYDTSHSTLCMNIINTKVRFNIGVSDKNEGVKAYVHEIPDEYYVAYYLRSGSDVDAVAASEQMYEAFVRMRMTKNLKPKSQYENWSLEIKAPAVYEILEDYDFTPYYLWGKKKCLGFLKPGDTFITIDTNYDNAIEFEYRGGVRINSKGDLFSTYGRYSLKSAKYETIRMNVSKIAKTAVHENALV